MVKIDKNWLYNLVTHCEFSYFIDNCNQMISEGWIPQGGVSYVKNFDKEGNEDFNYAQAFVKPKGSSGQYAVI